LDIFCYFPMKRKDNIFLDSMFRRPQTNMFDLSHDFKFSTNPGVLVPTMAQECLPGDVWNVAATDFVRFLPLRSPVMHRFRGSRYYFFVPNRILWSAFPDWIFDADSADENPYVIIDDVVPVGSLADFMGVPPGDYSNNAPYKVNLLPFAAYCLIHDEFFKQQFIQTPDFQTIVPGDNSNNWQAFILAPPLRAAWEKDYFTTALPFPQDSATGVQIPLTFQDNVPVNLNPADGTPGMARDADTGNILQGQWLSGVTGGMQVNPDTGGAMYDPNGTLSVDVQSDAALITDLRRAFRLQEFLEKIITGGKRYIETLLTIFGVQSSDARLQRPEYISGSKFNIVVSEVLATTADTAEVQPLGSMAGHGIAVSGTGSSTYRCEEHGWLLSLMVIRPDTAYQDGLHRSLTRLNPLDYALPDFALIGEQPVLRKEIQSVLFTGVDPEHVFGYQKRYSEYMYSPSRIASQFRTTLAFWHNGRIFDDINNPPPLNAEFIECNPRLDIFAVTDPDEDHIVVQTLNHVSCRRKLPRHAIPTI